MQYICRVIQNKQKFSKMKTQIFSNYDEFLLREDKSINGVDHQFKNVHPNWEEENATNIGCWNCQNCTNCLDCQHCTGCTSCVKCLFCKLCVDCKECSDSDNSIVCLRCVRAHSCVDSTDLDNCVYCLDCEKCERCSSCMHFNGGINKEDYVHIEKE